ncbi:hypothetical protein [Glaciibacter superstes]|uniref:hypothetical protein n=1 Tax=Glaciibacter superstes TaxID=501023 RepID=UPI0003B543A9|nr:hypothetical protein [Glaciibacter superstes]
MDMTVDGSLRRDGQPIELVRLLACSVGSSLDVLINLRVSGVLVARRRTTEVLSIQPVEDETGDELMILLTSL